MVRENSLDNIGSESLLTTQSLTEDELESELDRREEELNRESEKEERRKGCCLVGCLLLLLLFLLFFFALFLPVKKDRSGDAIDTSTSTGAAKWDLVSIKHYNVYKGWVANSKGLITIVQIKLTNIDSIDHMPSPGMVLLHEFGYALPFPVDENVMAGVINKKPENDPWLKSLKPGQSRIYTLAFQVPKPGKGKYELLVKDFNWTVPDYEKIAIGRIQSIISTADPYASGKTPIPKK